MVLIHFSLPSHDRSAHPQRVDVVGGVLLAIALGLAVIGLYNPAPDGKQVLPSYGLPLVGGAVLAAIAFAVWERFARTRLIEPAGVRFGPFLSSLGTSMCAGAALMVTLVNVELFGQGVLGKDQTEAAFLLLHFLIALPIGALVGGWIATKVGDRLVAVVGMLIAAGAYFLVSKWGWSTSCRPAITWARCRCLRSTPTWHWPVSVLAWSSGRSPRQRCGWCPRLSTASRPRSSWSPA